MSKISNSAARGYSIVELMVVMLIFSVVMTLISVSFSRMVRGSGHLLKNAETDIGGLIGLELMRSDLELAGFGLYWSGPGGGAPAISYKEALDDFVLVNSCPEGCPNAKPSLFDDSTYIKDRYIPRAYRVGNNVGFNGSDYLVLKGTALGTNKASRVWGYLNYGTGNVVTSPRDASGGVFGSGYRSIVLKSEIADQREVWELVLDKDDKNQTIFTAFYRSSFEKEQFTPKKPGDNFLVYGVDKPDDYDDTLPLRFPFNRADYYINRSDKTSAACAPGTGILYKTVITQTGWPAYYPILDCVADMQVMLSADINEDGVVDYHLDGEELDERDARETRDQLKEVRVYILAQQGRRDDSYSYPVADSERAIIVGDRDLMENPDDAYGSIWSASKMAATFGRNWRNYRWRLYTIVVQPKNL
jgi:prepilin-type N-terminal cleavage/methylation domain-containing protein